MSNFLFHPPGITTKSIGIDCSTHGRSCYEHHICGSLLAEDVVIHFRRLQFLVEGKEKSVIATYHILDGIDSCCVGFLKSKVTQFSRLYEGVLAQVTSVRQGSAFADIISSLPEEMIKQMKISMFDDMQSDESLNKITCF